MAFIFNSPSSGGDNWDNTWSYRQVVPVTEGALNQIRAMFQASPLSAGVHFKVMSASIGILSGTSGTSTKATPVELTFNGGQRGFEINNTVAGEVIASDWINFGGFSASDMLVVIFDLGTGSYLLGRMNNVTGAYIEMFNAVTFNVATVGTPDFGPSAEVNGVTTVETRGGAPIPNLSSLAVKRNLFSRRRPY